MYIGLQKKNKEKKMGIGNNRENSFKIRQNLLRDSKII